jgi:predicted MFS family arabinose efflux permease
VWWAAASGRHSDRVTNQLGAAYWRLWWANAVSTAGDGAFVTALPLLAVTITRNPELISLVAAVSYLPWLLLSLAAGVLADRHDRATLMWRSQLVQCAVVAVLTGVVAIHAADIAILAVAGFLLGSAQVVFSNAAQAVLPQLVPPAQLPKANGNQYVVQTVSQQFAGPPLGSFLFAAARALPFGLDAASFAGSALLLARLPTRLAAPGAADGGMLARVGEGLRWLRGHRLLRILAVLLGANNFFGQMGWATVVLLVTQTLHTGAREFGLLMIASAAGGVAGGLLNPALTRRIGELRSLVIACGANAVIYVTMRQRAVPDDMLGRVGSAYKMLGWGMIPLGALAGGLVAQAAGLRAPWIIAGTLRGLVLLALLPALFGAARKLGGDRQPGAGGAGQGGDAGRQGRLDDRCVEGGVVGGEAGDDGLGGLDAVSVCEQGGVGAAEQPVDARHPGGGGQQPDVLAAGDRSRVEHDQAGVAAEGVPGARAGGGVVDDRRE